MTEKTVLQKIALIGLGPKGLYGLERLLANLAMLEDTYPVEIHLFNKSDSFGAGDIYNPDQPSYLLMNYANGFINMWPEEEPKPIASEPKSFVDWLKNHSEEFPEANASTYSSRATVGRYLSEGFEDLLRRCPNEVSILRHVGEVTAIQKHGETYNLLFRNSVSKSKSEIQGLQTILIATGHPCINDPESLSHRNHVDFIYPVNRRLQNIPSGAKVAIKGMGLTFIDAVLALTEGRRGKFEIDESGNISYTKSGFEPSIIHPFSTSGLPMIPRGNTCDILPYKPFYFREESLESIAPLDGKYDFEQQLLPLIEKEYTAVYYRKKFRENGEKLLLYKDFTLVESQIERFHEHFPKAERFDFHRFLEKPFSVPNLHSDTLGFIQRGIYEAEIGVNQSAFAAVADLWRHLSVFFNELYKFGGLMPQSQQVFLEKYAGHLNRISYGPPIINMKKILALAEAGIIDFSFSKNPQISTADTFSLTISGQKTVRADYLVDARIPKVQLHSCAGELYENMLAEQLIFPYVNRQEGRLDFRPGCPAINEKGHPVDETGLVNEAITFVGTPTEGLTYDNDTLSRKRNDFVSDWAKDLMQTMLLQSGPQFNPTY